MTLRTVGREKPLSISPLTKGFRFALRFVCEAGKRVFSFEEVLKTAYIGLSDIDSIAGIDVTILAGIIRGCNG